MTVTLHGGIVVGVYVNVIRFLTLSVRLIVTTEETFGGVSVSDT
jgi:hypothetical protein